MIKIIFGMLMLVIVGFESLNLSAQSDTKIISDAIVKVDEDNVDKYAGLDSTKLIRTMLIDSIIDYGKTFVGLKYRYGGITPAGFDCSGFMFHIHRHFNLPLPRVPSATCLIGDRIPLDSLQPGDLVYFKTRSGYDNTIGHVGMVIEKVPDSFIFIHSASHAGLVIENFADHSYYVNKYLFANRLPDEFYLRQWNDSLMKIYRFKNEDLYKEQTYAVVSAEQPEGTTMLTYTVKSGDMLGLISSWYKINVNELMAWNGLGSTRLSIGQNLKVYIKDELVSTYKGVNELSFDDKQRLAGVSPSSNKPVKTETKEDSAYEYYIVKAGDTPFGISKKFAGTTVDGILKLNGITNPSSLQIGQKLKIRKKT